MADPVTHALDETSGTKGTVGRAAWWLMKKAALGSLLMTPFALAAAPAEAAEMLMNASENLPLGEAIMSGEAGFFDAIWETTKFIVMDLVPYSWSHVDDIGAALATSAGAGSELLAEGAQGLAELTND